MIKIDVFDKIDDLSHINSFEQHCAETIIIRMDVIKTAHLSRKCFTVRNVHTLVGLHQKNV